jgi:hypothetical protein
MSETMSKAQKRNLRQQVGSAAADVVTSMKDTVTRIELAHQVLARQMLDFETTASRLVESRAVDLKTAAALREQVESAHAKINAERTHVLQLAEEQRFYVDGATLRKRCSATPGSSRSSRHIVARRGVRVDDVLAASALAVPRRVAAASHAALASAEPRGCASPAGPRVARDAYEAAWTDLGRPAAGGSASRGSRRRVMARRINGERLNEEGLDHHERLVRLEKSVYGSGRVDGLMDVSEILMERVQALESADRRQRMPFFLRWFLPEKR